MRSWSSLRFFSWHQSRFSSANASSSVRPASVSTMPGEPAEYGPAVRGLIDGLLGQSEAIPVNRSGGVAVTAINSWIHAMGHADPALAGMACTLTALVLSGRRLHVLHVGDTRLYRLRDGQFVFQIHCGSRGLGH